MCCAEKESPPTPVSIIGWRAYYENGQVYSSTSLDWESLPDDGLQHVNVYFSDRTSDGQFPRRVVLSGYDWYFQFPTEHGFVYAGSNDSAEEVGRRYPGAVLKRGKWVHPQVTREVEARAKADRWP